MNNPPTDTASLQEQIQRLADIRKGTLRSAFWVGAGGGLILSLAVTITALQMFGHDAGSGNSVVKAQGFVLEDEQGKPRSSWIMDKKGPRLQFFAEDGKKRMSLYLMEDGKNGPIFSVYDDSEMLRAAMTVDISGNPHFLLSDPGQKPRLHMAVSRTGAPSMVLIHKDGQMPAGIGVHANGQPWYRGSLESHQPETMSPGEFISPGETSATEEETPDKDK